MVRPGDKYRYGYLEAILSIIGNLLLFGLKYYAGIVTGSIAIIADAWHTLSDSASSVVVLGSVKLAGRKPDEKHPFGHGRYQEIAAIFIAFLLGIIAYEFFRDSVEKFRSGAGTDFGTLAIVATALSLLIKEAMAQYAFWTYRKTGFQSLKADGWHHRSDALSSLVVLIGILLGNRFWWMDSVLGLAISLMLFYAVYEIIHGSVDKLLGEKPGKELIDRIHEIITRTAGPEIEPHHFHLHTYGDHKELTFHIRLSGKLDISSGHRIATDIENAIRNELEIEATIHVEPKLETRG
jgi:cation diffusion facilitator family transporter